MLKRIISVLIILVMAFQICCLSASAAEDEERPNLLVLGDSIAAGTGLVAPEECCYGALIAKANGYNYQNLAYSGRTARSLAWQLEDYIEEYYMHSYVQKIYYADIIIISVGGNDLLWGNLVEKINQAFVYNNYKMIDTLILEYKLNIKSIISSINTINPDATVMVQTLYNPRFDMLANVYQYASDNINRVIREVEQELPGYFYVVDVAKDLGRNPFYYSVDTLHPSKLGHYEIAKTYLKSLYDLGLGTELTPPRQPTMFEIPDYFERLKEVINEYMDVIMGFLQ